MNTPEQIEKYKLKSYWKTRVKFGYFVDVKNMFIGKIYVYKVRNKIKKTYMFNLVGADKCMYCKDLKPNDTVIIYFDVDYIPTEKGGLSQLKAYKIEKRDKTIKQEAEEVKQIKYINLLEQNEYVKINKPNTEF